MKGPHLGSIGPASSALRGWGAGLVLCVACGAGDKDSAPEGVLPAPYPDPSCEGWYGQPSETTGMDAETCVAAVPGDHGTWTPPAWSAEAVADLASWTLLDPPAVPEDDPYAGPSLTPDESSVCGVALDAAARSYRVQTFDSAEAAAGAGAVVTHGGACGLCSSLADLAVYAGISDLTGPVRQCGIAGLDGGLESTDQCLQDLGFTPPCARIWAFNARHTQQSCLDDCLALLDAPYHEADGSLNACLQCDEDESGPVFKTVAGRTRRNSGLATALCRPCDTVWRVEHEGVL